MKREGEGDEGKIGGGGREEGGGRREEGGGRREVCVQGREKRKVVEGRSMAVHANTQQLTAAGRRQSSPFLVGSSKILKHIRFRAPTIYRMSLCHDIK